MYFNAVLGTVLHKVFQAWGVFDPFSEWLGEWLKMHVSQAQVEWTAAGVLTLISYAVMLWIVWRYHRLPQIANAIGVTAISTPMPSRIRENIYAPQPDMTINDAVDYIINDSKTAFDKPYRLETPKDFPASA